MNAVSLGKTKTLLIVRGAGLLALAALAIAFFALPFASDAMKGCGKKSKSAAPAGPPSMATIFSTDIPHDIGLMQNLPQYDLIGVYQDANASPFPDAIHMKAMNLPIEYVLSATAAQPIKISTSNWLLLRETVNGAFTFKQGIAVDTNGDLWLTDGTWGHITKLPANVAIVAAAQSQQSTGGASTNW